MHHRYTLLFAFLFPAILPAQPIDRMYQPSLLSTYKAVLRSTDGHWWAGGEISWDNSFSTTGMVRCIDDAGNLLLEHPVFVPEYELTEVHALAQLPSGAILAAGLASPGCDFGPFLGLLEASLDGTTLWQHGYTAGQFDDVALNDTLIAALASDSLVFVDFEGDSLGQVKVGYGYGQRVRRSPHGFWTMGYNGIKETTTNGPALDSLTQVNAEDVLALAGGQLVLLTTDSLLLLTADLQRTGSGVTLPGVNPRRLYDSAGTIIVQTAEQVFRFSPTLQSLDVLALPPVNGYTATTGALDGNTFMTAGHFYTGMPISSTPGGATGAALRSFDLGTFPSPLEADVALSTVEVDSMDIALDAQMNVTVIHGEIWLRFWLVNRGDAMLQQAHLERVIPYAICGAAGEEFFEEDLSLAPGDSVQLTRGPFPVHEYTIDSVPFIKDICIWASCPDERIDRNVLDNEGCAQVLIPLGLSEHEGRTPPAVYPNPFTDRITIDLPPGDGQRSTIMLCDALGRPVPTGNVRSTSDRRRLDLPGLPPGLYLLSIITDGERRVQRIVRE